MATHPSTQEHYDQNAGDYHRHVSTPTESVFHAYYEKPAIRSLLPNLKGLEVISIGCGSGVDTRWLADNGAKKVVGIDISKGLLDIARKENPDIEFRQMDMEQLDFADESFDLAYSSLAIHYVDDWTQSLAEARRILRPGGLYVFSCGHPIDSAMEYEETEANNYARLGRTVNLASKKRTVYGDYLAAQGDGVRPIGGTLATVKVIVYHRTFSKMIEHILASGFTIEQLVEPQPQPKLKKINPGLHEQLTRVPGFMVWVLKKS